MTGESGKGSGYRVRLLRFICSRAKQANAGTAEAGGQRHHVAADARSIANFPHRKFADGHRRRRPPETHERENAPRQGGLIVAARGAIAPRGESPPTGMAPDPKTPGRWVTAVRGRLDPRKRVRERASPFVRVTLVDARMREMGGPVQTGAFLKARPRLNQAPNEQTLSELRPPL